MTTIDKEELREVLGRAYYERKNGDIDLVFEAARAYLAILDTLETAASTVATTETVDDLTAKEIVHQLWHQAKITTREHETIRKALSAPDHAENKPLRNIIEWMANDEAGYNADELRMMAKKALLLCETKKGGA